MLLVQDFAPNQLTQHQIFNEGRMSHKEIYGSLENNQSGKIGTANHVSEKLIEVIKIFGEDVLLVLCYIIRDVWLADHKNLPNTQ